MAFLGPLLAGALPSIIRGGTSFIGGLIKGEKPLQALQTGLSAAFQPSQGGDQPITGPIEMPRAMQSPVNDIPVATINPQHVTNEIQPYRDRSYSQNRVLPYDPQEEFIRKTKRISLYEPEPSGMDVFSSRPRRELTARYLAQRVPMDKYVEAPYTKTSSIEMRSHDKKSKKKGLHRR